MIRKDSIDQVIDIISDYINLRDTYLTTEDVELFNDGAISESEAESVIFKINQKLGFLKEYLIDFQWAETETDQKEALENIGNYFEDIYSFCEENLTTEAFNELKENILDGLEG